MRYEAKNKYFKEIATIGNFKNIGKTVSSRHQRYMCYRMTCTDNFLGGETTYGVGKSMESAQSYVSCSLIEILNKAHLGLGLVLW